MNLLVDLLNLFKAFIRFACYINFNWGRLFEVRARPFNRPIDPSFDNVCYIRNGVIHKHYLNAMAATDCLGVVCIVLALILQTYFCVCE